jgi:tetratricopeptide (TPR) repeat protein
MRTLVIASIFAVASTLSAADDPRIAEGVALHDAGRYDEAIAKYRAILADDPKNEMAAYELALSATAKGDDALCIATIEPLAKKKGRFQAPMLTVLGNCFDHAGQADRAIDAYRRGVKIAPDDANLLYNYAVTLAARGRNEDARQALKKALAVRPLHPNSHYLLAVVFAAENFRSAALLSYLRFLSLEPGTERAAQAAQRVLVLLNLGVQQKEANEITVNIDTKTRKEEGDFGGWEMMLGIVSAARFAPEEAPQTAFDQTRGQLASALRMLIETRQDLGRNYTAQHVVPFFAALEEKKLLDTYAGIALSTLELHGTQEWVKANEQAIRTYVAFVGQ